MRQFFMAVLACLAGCSHPLEIAGEGDILSASGERDCSLEEYNAGAPTCSENYISGAYDEIYQALPRPGWEFEGWENCQHANPQTQYCGFSVPAKTVQYFWGNTAPPLVAYFTEFSAAVPPITDLYDATTNLAPAQQISTASALITRFADRARDRHAREDEFHSYDHYLSFYWEHRTAAVEIVDTIGRGGNTITFNVTTQWKLSPNEAELRFFYRGINTVAEYHNNGVMTQIDDTHYTRSVSYNSKTNAPLQIGDRLEFELSQFLEGVPNGRNNYYGTTYLYIVGQGIVPWETRGVFGDLSTEREDSFPISATGWLGGETTLPYEYSNEPDNHFLQMATNLSSINGQNFVLGRRVHHTDFEDGGHNESPQNPPFDALAGLLGNHYVNHSCVSCHTRNGRALPPAVGEPLKRYVVKVGDVDGNPDPSIGAVLQPESSMDNPEAGVTLGPWQESNGLRRPSFVFSGGATRVFFSAYCSATGGTGPAGSDQRGRYQGAGGS